MLWKRERLVAMMKTKGCSGSYLRLCPPCGELENSDEGNMPDPDWDDDRCSICGACGFCDC